VLKAIRENEPRAISLGYRSERYKLVAFVLSAMFAGVAGATKALVFQLASLTDVDWPMSGEVILMTLVGGLGTLFGPVVGAFFMVALENYLTTIAVGIRRSGHNLRRLRSTVPPWNYRRAGPCPAYQTLSRSGACLCARRGDRVRAAGV
jgi:ABC-type branched-subunit amino acid transport system permease subunit